MHKHLTKDPSDVLFIKKKIQTLNMVPADSNKAVVLKKYYFQAKLRTFLCYVCLLQHTPKAALHFSSKKNYFGPFKNTTSTFTRYILGFNQSLWHLAI